MKHTSLLTSLFLSITLQAMEITTRRNLERLANINFNNMIVIRNDTAIYSPYNNMAPIHVACQKNQTETVQNIIKEDPTTTTLLTVDGKIPLHFACQFGSKKCVELLFNINKNTINQQDYNGMTPLHVACIYKKLRTIKFLIKKGANPTIKNNSQLTPVYYICDTLNMLSPSVCKKMIHKKDKHKNTQFHLFTMAQHYDNNYLDEAYLQTLISYDLNIWSRNKQGKTAVDLVCQHHKKFNKQYMAQNLPILKTIADQEERLMHIFLRIISPYIKTVLFKEIFTQQSDLCNNPFPTELQKYIMCMYYALNIETIVAKKYKDSIWIHDDYVENKKIVRELLLKEPEPRLLWSNS